MKPQPKKQPKIVKAPLLPPRPMFEGKKRKPRKKPAQPTQAAIDGNPHNS